MTHHSPRETLPAHRPLPVHWLRAAILVLLALAPLGGAVPGTLLLLGAVPSALRRWGDALFGAATFPVFSLAVVALASGTGASHPGLGLASAAALVLLLLAAFTATSYLEADPDFTARRALPAALAGAAVAAVYTLATVFWWGRPHGATPFTGYNNSGTLLLAFGTLGTGYLLSRTDRLRRLALPFGALLAVAVLFTLSRGSWIGMGVAVLILLLRERVCRKALGWLAVLGAVAWLVVPGALPSALVQAASTLGAISPSPFVHRLVTRLASIGDPDQQMVRFAVWLDTLRLIRDHPWLGVGLGNFAAAFPAYVTHPAARWGPATPHNLWLTVAAEMGLTGLAAFTWLMARTARAAYRLWRHGHWLHVSLAAAFAGLLAREMVDHTVHSVHVGVVFWLIVAWLLVAEARWREPDPLDQEPVRP